MELAAEIGPEVWLVPDAAWNATALAPGATRTVNLSTRRSRAPNGSPLPRYTYFGVRTKDGATARLLVQDSDAPAVAAGRTIRLDLATRSFIVPEVVSRTASNPPPWISMCAGVQNVSRPIDRCHEISQCTPTMEDVLASTAHHTYQGTARAI